MAKLYSSGCAGSLLIGARSQLFHFLLSLLFSFFLSFFLPLVVATVSSSFLYLHRSLFLSFSFKKYSGRGKDGHPKRSPSHRSTSSSPSRAAPAARKCYTRTYVFSVQIWEMWNCVSSMIFGAAMVTQHPSPILMLPNSLFIFPHSISLIYRR